MILEDVLSDRIARFFAVVSVSTYVLLWFLSALIDGQWVFGTNMVSDLGVSHEPIAVALFTLACVIGGIGFLCYGAISSRFVTGKVRKTYYAMFAVCGFCLVFVGLFNESTEFHKYFAWALFILGTVGAALALYDDVKYKNATLVKLSTMLFVIALCLWAFFPLPLVEAFGIIFFLIWVLARVVFVEAN